VSPQIHVDCGVVWAIVGGEGPSGVVGQEFQELVVAVAGGIVASFLVACEIRKWVGSNFCGVDTG
jgi:hypothetical protein